MSQMATFGSAHLSFAHKAQGGQAAASISAPANSTRFRDRQENHCYLSWLVAISGSFLIVGMVGMLIAQPFGAIELGGRAGLGATDGDAIDVSMADLLADNEAPQVNPDEIPQEETPEIPTPQEMALELEDLPVLTEALDVEDLFTIPTAPKIETAMKPVDPAKPKPEPKPSSVAKQRSSRAASPNAMAGGTTGAGGGNGGTGTQGAGAGGKSRTPQPPYPPGARSRGVVGSVSFTIRVNLLGKVESAAVTSSNGTNGGFTSADQSYVAAYIQRNWLLERFAGKIIRQSIKFELR